MNRIRLLTSLVAVIVAIAIGRDRRLNSGRSAKNAPTARPLTRRSRSGKPPSVKR